MYFYDTIEPGYIEDEEPAQCVCRCEKCEALNFLYFDQCETVIDKKYAKLKDGIEFACDECGEKADQIIPYRSLDDPEPQTTNQYVPKCMICHSPNIHKITLGTKVSRAAIFGIFSLPKAGNQWKCDNCGSEF